MPLRHPDYIDGKQIGLTRCPGGCACLQFGLTMVHLPPEAFRLFVHHATKVLSELFSDSHCNCAPENRRLV